MEARCTIYQVDAFTSSPFRGNPAGVCILDKKPSRQWMQNIAAEMNLSETAFVFPGSKGLNIRYFSPAAEIPLCGHATLSTGHIMFETGFAEKRSEIVLFSRAGRLKVKYDRGWIKMDFPAYLSTAVRGYSKFIGTTGITPQELYHTGHGWTLAVMRNEDEVRDLKPDFVKMKDSEYGDLIVTASSSDKRFDFCVRCFAPALGIDEDPVTGSAHCALVPFWHERTGKKRFMSHQVSKRGGILRVELKGNRVEISGKALTIFKAESFV